MKHLAALLVLLAAPIPGHAETASPRDSVARALRELTPPAAGFGDGALVELVQRAMMEAAGAEAALTAPLPRGARLPRGTVGAADLATLAHGGAVRRVRLDGASLLALLERSAALFAEYTYDSDRPLMVVDGTDSLVDALEGVSYEIDLARPPDQRVQHVMVGGAPLDPDRMVTVAVDERRLARGDLPEPEPGFAVPLHQALETYVRRLGVLRGTHDHSGSIFPDYALARERPLIDRLVRHGFVPPAEVHRLFADLPARRGEGAYWLARVFGWRERRLSGAFPDVGDSLEPWIDGLLRRDVLGDLGHNEFFEPFRPLDWPMFAAWCVAAARAAQTLPDSAALPAWRRSLRSGTTSTLEADTLERGELLGMIANLRLPALRVVATTDFHGALSATTVDGRPRGGAAALAGHIARLRGENPEGTVVLDAGDLFQGTMISNLAFGRPVVELLNHAGYDAAAIGNHEFDWSADTLAARARELQGPFLAANLREDGVLPTWARSDTQFVRRGVRIAVLGLCYPHTETVTHRRVVRGFTFADDSTTAARAVPGLRRAGARVVVGLGHIPGIGEGAAFRGDLARLARGVPGVDLWIGGHGHDRALATFATTSAMIPKSHGLDLAVCDLVVDAVEGRVIERLSRLVPVWGDEVPPDSGALAILERWQTPIAARAAAVLGANAAHLGRDEHGESPIGSLVADVMREAAGTEIALQNNGGVRADLPAGPVTAGHIYAVLPFDNTIWTLELTGAELRGAIEEGLAVDRVLQVSGLRYRFDTRRPPLDRVVAIEDSAGRPLDEARTYAVACNDFLASGGNDYATLAGGTRRQDTGLSLRDVLGEYVRRKCADGGVLEVRGDGRIAREDSRR